MSALPITAEAVILAEIRDELRALRKWLEQVEAKRNPK